MGKQTVYLLVEPAQAKPVWFLCMEDSLRQSCRKKRLTLRTVDDPGQLDRLAEKPVSVLVICSQNNWTRHTVNELQRRHIMPVLLGVLPSLFGDSVSGIIMARRVLIGKVMDYFVGCGRRRMALVGVNRNAGNDNVKTEAFLQISRERGLPVTESISTSSEAAYRPSLP